jgi:hypothetical protein
LRTARRPRSDTKPSQLGHPIGRTCELVQASLFGGTKKFLHSANLQATIQAARFLRILLKSPFKKLLLGSGLWRHTYIKMSANLKSNDMLKDAKCKKRQLSQRPPILYVPVVDVITPKEEPTVLKVKLPDNSHISVPIFSPVRTTRNTLHTSLQSSASWNRKDYQRSVGCLRRP